MDLSNKYCLYVGTSRGVLQWSYCKPEEKVAFTVPDHQSEVTALEWGREEDEIIVGYKNEQVNLYNTTQNKYVKTIRKLEGEGPIVGVAPVSTSILIAKQDGIISVWNGKKSDYFSINLEENATLDAINYNKIRSNVVGTGGECNDFKTWDIETKKCIFKAKSMGHDELNLPIPTSVKGITSFPECEQLYACATKEGHVLLYDERAQRRPVTKFFEKKASYICIASAFRERQCFVGTTRGYMQLLDMRAGKSVRTWTTFTGSVTSIVCDAVNPFVATTSLDRYLRVYHLETKELVYKVYLKQNLTKVLMKPLVKEEQEEPVEKPFVDEEYEEIFNTMETITDQEPTEKTKRKSSSDNGVKKKKKKVKSL